MSLIAFSVRRTSLVKPRYLWAALKVTLEKRVRITGRCHRRFSTMSVRLQNVPHLGRYERSLWGTSWSNVEMLLRV